MTAHMDFAHLGLHVEYGGDLIEHTTAVYDKPPPAATYRYLLKCRWNTTLPTALWIARNPSDAGAHKADPTSRRIRHFSIAAKCGGYEIMNLFALQATDPTELQFARDPIGSRADDFLAAVTRHSGRVIVAWGAVPPGQAARAAEVARSLTAAGVRLECLGLTKAGQPRHPLYVRGTTPLRDYQPLAVTA